MTPEQHDALRGRIAETIAGLPTRAQLATLLPELAVETETSPRQFFMDARGIYAIYGPVNGETILQAFEAAAAGNPVLTRALTWLNQASSDGVVGGVDVGADSTRGMIDSLTGSVFTAPQAATLKALGEQTVMRWPGLTLEELEALYRPEQEVLYRDEQALITARGAEILATAEAEWQTDAEYWALYQATPNAQNQALRDALEQADVELRQEGLIRG